jgi:hypothetical protein
MVNIYVGANLPKKRHGRKKPRKPPKIKPPPKVHNYSSSEPVANFWTANSGFSDTLSSSGIQFHSGTQVLGANTRQGVSNPFWKDQVKLGSNATTTFIGEKFDGQTNFWSGYAIGTQINPNGSIHRKWDYYQSGFVSIPNPANLLVQVPPASVVTDVHNRCIRKFLNEVSEARTSDNLTGRSIRHFKHDLHSTLHPMAGIQSKIQSYLTKLKKVPYGKLKGPSIVSTITQSYLEFKFGVEPFTVDISDILADMVIRDRKRNPSVPVEATAHADFAGSSSIHNLVDGGYLTPVIGASVNTLSIQTYSERMKGAVRTGIDDNGRLGIVQDNKLLPEDWLPTAYSIMPYAWMVNYFTNIRDIIDAASLRYSNVVWGCFNIRQVCTYQQSAVYAQNPNPFAAPGLVTNGAVLCSGGHSTLVHTKVQRYVLTPSSLIPDFQWKIPTTPTPWFNMMAAFLPSVLGIEKTIASSFR